MAVKLLVATKYMPLCFFANGNKTATHVIYQGCTTGEKIIKNKTAKYIFSINSLLENRLEREIALIGFHKSNVMFDYY